MCCDASRALKLAGLCCRGVLWCVVCALLFDHLISPPVLGVFVRLESCSDSAGHGVCRWKVCEALVWRGPKGDPSVPVSSSTANILCCWRELGSCLNLRFRLSPATFRSLATACAGRWTPPPLCAELAFRLVCTNDSSLVLQQRWLVGVLRHLGCCVVLYRSTRGWVKNYSLLSIYRPWPFVEYFWVVAGCCPLLSCAGFCF